LEANTLLKANDDYIDGRNDCAEKNDIEEVEDLNSSNYASSSLMSIVSEYHFQQESNDSLSLLPVLKNYCANESTSPY
ncbi:6130_t:CDS:2, partial [Acaulospora morrowiae]